LGGISIRALARLTTGINRTRNISDQRQQSQGLYAKKMLLFVLYIHSGRQLVVSYPQNGHGILKKSDMFDVDRIKMVDFLAVKFFGYGYQNRYKYNK
jgi:hypothetical protein